MSYLSKMTEEQTLVMYSGHPLGLFPSSPGAPRLVITNGMVSLRRPIQDWAWKGDDVDEEASQTTLPRSHSVPSSFLGHSQLLLQDRV